MIWKENYAKEVVRISPLLQIRFINLVHMFTKKFSSKKLFAFVIVSPLVMEWMTL